ncbi:DUF2860 family protein [Chromobacterium vaccinii]|uniref:DUF2860 family protein n=1 Tax=Chromobacterium TaxID=535 RepID=UPI00130524B8|nr:DUF2860 family protein [Chromobacterium sp. ATCC 53434]
MKKLASTLMMMVAPGLVWAADAAQPDGWSGSIGLGLGFYQVSSNFVKSQNDNRKTITTLNQQPASDDYATALPRGSLFYSIPGSQTQLFFGLAPVEKLGLGSALQLGARHRFDDQGLLTAGFTYDQQEVWTDPYALNVARSDTKLKTSGFGVNWDGILGTGVTAGVSYNHITLGQESSGQAAGLSAADQNRLRRSGSSVDAQLGYAFKLDGSQTLTPALIYGKNNADGDAMRFKRAGVKLDYEWKAGANVLQASLAATKTRYDAGNPLFAGAKADSSDLLASATYIRNGIWGYKPVSAYASLLYGKSDSDIAFFYGKVGAVNVGVSYNF